MKVVIVGAAGPNVLDVIKKLKASGHSVETAESINDVDPNKYDVGIIGNELSDPKVMKCFPKLQKPIHFDLEKKNGIPKKHQKKNPFHK